MHVRSLMQDLKATRIKVLVKALLAMAMGMALGLGMGMGMGDVLRVFAEQQAADHDHPSAHAIAVEL